MSGFLPKVWLIALFPDNLFLKLHCPIFNLQPLNYFIIRYLISRAQNLKSPCGKETLDQVYLGTHIRTRQGKWQNSRGSTKKRKRNLAVRNLKNKVHFYLQPFKTSSVRLICCDSLSAFTRSLETTVSFMLLNTAVQFTFFYYFE